MDDVRYKSTDTVMSEYQWLRKGFFIKDTAVGIDGWNNRFCTYPLTRFTADEVYEDTGDTLELSAEGYFWHHIPRCVAYTYTEDASLVKTARDLARCGKHSSSLWYWPDLRFNPLRLICVVEVLRRQGKKFKKYYPTQK